MKTKIKKRILNLSLMLFLVVLFSFNVLSQLNIEKEYFVLGEKVTIQADLEEDQNIRIFFEEDVFELIRTDDNEHFFYPSQTGIYEVELFDSNEILDLKKIEVVEEGIISSKLRTDKEHYSLGEEVNILFSGPDVSSVDINSPSNNYKLMGSADFPLSFFPDKEGDYKIIVKTGEGSFETNFEVSSIIKKEVVQRVDVVEEVIFNKRMDDNVVETKTKDSLVRGEVYDVELKKQGSSVKDLKIKNYVHESEFVVDVKELEPRKNNLEKTVKSFSIDIGAEFDEAIFTSVAKGTELYSCIEINIFGECDSWNKEMNLTPGEEYEVVVNEKNNIYAETGVASINTKKSIYKTGETAEIVVVVLDKYGFLVPRAEVEINVTTPENKVYTYSSVYNEVKDGGKGIYYVSHFNTSVEGYYGLSVKVDALNVDHGMKSYFIVQDDYEFDIIRDTPVTIDPFKGPFVSSINISPRINVSSYSFTEVLPSEFSVYSAPGAIIKEEGDKKLLVWDNLIGETMVEYVFNSPFIIPYLWEQGPSKITFLGNEFFEARQWYLAVDPITYYDPTSTITSEWVQGTGITHEEINDGVRQPNTPNTGDYVASDMNDGHVSEFGFPSVIETGVESLTLWVYTSTGNNAQYTFSLLSGTTTLCSDNVLSSQASAWRNCTIANPTADLSGLSAHLSEVTRDGGGQPTTAFVYAIYLEVDTGNPPPNVTLISPDNESIVESNPVNFTFKAVDDVFSSFSCALYANYSGSWIEEETLNNAQNNTEYGFEVFTSDGFYVWNVMCENTDGKSAFAEDNRSVFVNVNKPSITDYAINTTSIRQNRTIRFNTSITDSFDIDTATITIKKPDDELVTNNLLRNGDEFYFNITDTLNPGIYNITEIWANDSLGQINFLNPSLSFEVLLIPPSAFNLTNPVNNTESRILVPTFSWEETETPDFYKYELRISRNSDVSSPVQIHEIHDMTNTSLTLSSALDANEVYYWRVTAFDIFNNKYESQIFRYVTDRTNPTVTLNNPVNNHKTNQQLITFAYTPNDANTLDYCELYTDSTGSFVVSQTNYSISKGVLNYFSFFINEGVKKWNVRCFDNATNNAFAVNNRTLIVDVSGPVISLLSPEEDVLINDTNIVEFNASANDLLSDLDYCELLINGSVKETKYDLSNNVEFSFNTFLSNNYYEWNVRCYDVLGNSNTSASRFLTVESLDLDSPVITLNYPNQDEHLSFSSVNFNFSVQDATGIENCSLYLDDVLTSTNYDVNNFDYNYFLEENVAEGLRNWSVECYDNSTELNKGVSSTRDFFVDLTDPVVVLESPANDSFLNYSSINFNYVPTDDNLDSCVLTTNITGSWEETQTQSNPVSGSTNTITRSIPDGVFLWNINCFDLSGRNSFAEKNYSLSVDTTPPQYYDVVINPSSPTNYVQNNVYWFNISWEDNFVVDSVWLEHNFSGSTTNEFIPNSSSVYYFSVQDLDAGIYNYKWFANDSLNNINQTIVFTYIINKAVPSIKLYLNNTEDNVTVDEGTPINLLGEISNPGDGYLELFVNDDKVVEGSSSVSINYFFEDPGMYNVTLVFNETNNFEREQKTFFVFVNDITPPVVTLISPSNDSLVASGNRNLIFNVEDFSNISRCDLYLQEELNQTMYDVPKGVDQSFNLDLEPGSYNWSVVCVDSESNIGYSELRFFTAVIATNILLYSEMTNESYEQGVDAVTLLNTTDVFGNSLQTSITNHIIFGDTDKTWWDSAWKKRRPLQITESESIDQTNALVGVNVTGINVSSCVNELRIINHEFDSEEIHFRVYDGNDENWCFVTFYANMSADETSNNFYAYYGNPSASNPNYNLDVSQISLFNAQTAQGDEGTPTGVANLVGKDDNTAVNLYHGGGGDIHSAHGRDFINETFGPIQKVEASYRYEVLSIASATWALRFSVNNGTSYTNSFGGATTVAKTTSSWHDVTNQYSSLTWENVNNTRLQGRIVKTGGGQSAEMNLFWVELRITHYKKPIATANTILGEELLINTTIKSTNANGYLEVLWNSKGADLGLYSSVSRASAQNYDLAFNHSTFNITPDITPPNVTLISPDDGLERGKGFVDFVFDVYDPNLESCILFMGSAQSPYTNITSMSVFNGENIFENVDVGLGFWEWNVHCNDTASNVGFADANFTLNITGPDLAVFSDDIWFSDEERIEGNVINMSVNISNLGLSNAEEDFLVQFFYGDPGVGGIEFDQIIVNGLEVQESITLSVNYDLKAGRNNLFVLVDGENVVDDADLSNNKANKSISVELYQYFYGVVSVDIVLADSSEVSFLDYLEKTGLPGHVLVSNADSSFSYEDLQSVTRNIDGAFVNNAFSEVDSALNTTSFDDSILDVWGGGDNTPLMEKDFKLSTGNITGVPIINSTNHDFVTGILWDVIDDLGNERFDSSDAEDLIFITEIKPETQGKYGVYDYEIRVPALLRDYKSDSGKLSFYIEII